MSEQVLHATEGERKMKRQRKIKSLILMNIIELGLLRTAVLLLTNFTLLL